ncbi:hypothetical protein BN1263120010 [Stenotrophomonas maltophilia]|nr:hypothetical protein BN1263120010 [Stenotrophomonas maltophilia]
MYPVQVGGVSRERSTLPCPVESTVSRLSIEVD